MVMGCSWLLTMESQVAWRLFVAGSESDSGERTPPGVLVAAFCRNRLARSVRAFLIGPFSKVRFHRMRKPAPIAFGAFPRIRSDARELFGALGFRFLAFGEAAEPAEFFVARLEQFIDRQFADPLQILA